MSQSSRKGISEAEEERKVFLEGLASLQTHNKADEHWKLGISEALEEIITLLGDIRDKL